MIDLAKRTGTWDGASDAQNTVMPEDFAKALAKRKTAAKYFEAFPPSAKRIIFEWIVVAKRPETRRKRIAETVEKAARNVRAK